MKRLAALASLLLATHAHAVDYTNAKITGVAIVAGESHIRFTIDQDPNAVFRTNEFSGEQLDRVVALIMAAYVAESPVAFIRSSEASSSSPRHYTELLALSVGSFAFD